MLQPFHESNASGHEYEGAEDIFDQAYNVISDLNLTNSLTALYQEDPQFGSLVRSRRFAPESIVANAEELASNLYILVEGTVNLISMDPHGRRLVVSRLGSGAIFGEGEILPPGEPNLYAETEDEASVWIIAASQARNVALRYPILSWALLRTSSERLGQIVVNMESVAYRKLPERLAGLLLELSKPENALTATGREKRERRMVGNISHQKLADTLGTYRESVSALLRNLKSEGIVEIGYRWIRILDVEALSDLANADY